MGTLLVIDDDELHLQLIVDSFVASDHEIYTARQAQAGLDLARRIEPDLILMDIALPGLNGLEAIKLIRHDPTLADIPIIAVTATRTIEMARQLTAAGADDIINKPFQLNQLREFVNKYLNED